jgi:hypothetical protein
MKTRGVPVLVTLATFLLGGCYTTKIYTGAIAAGPEMADRQWFTIGGLVPLSDPTGQACPAGLARAESQLAGFDILINIGLAIAGGVAGTLACSGSSDETRAGCTSAGAGLAPFLIASRTVRYSCAGGVTAPGAWPPPVQAPPAPYAPPPPAPPMPPPGAPVPPPPAPLPPPPAPTP